MRTLRWCNAVFHVRQKSRAIAKMTTRCALYMDALKKIGSPWLRPGLLFPKLLMGFCCARSIRSTLTPFLGFVHVWPIQEPHIFQWADQRNWLRTLHQISGVWGDTKSDILTWFWGGLTRFWGEKKNIWPLITPPWGAGSAEIFMHDRGL